MRGAPYLSEVTIEKVAVICEACGLQRRYDRRAVLERVGDLKMPELLNEIARREGCPRLDVRWGEQCGLVYHPDSRAG